jgi:arylsulfatase A-like enzyme
MTVLAIAALSALIALAGCARAPRFNLLFVTFDTTRADHIGCYGHAAARTPTVDRLAREGVRFARAYTAVPITLPSHSTMFTGKYPPRTGVRDNGMFVLPAEQTTLAEVLKARGYATAAAIGGFPLLRKFGLDQGFDLYDDRLEVEYEDAQARRAVRKSRLYFDERRAGRVNEAVRDWLERNASRPFFLWVHYFDAHQPQEPPPPYDQLFANAPYDGEIAYADESLGGLIAHLERLGAYERTLVVFLSDHGEGLGEHRELTHSYLLYDTTLRVPLIVRLPGGVPGRGQVVEQRVGTVDVMPTILDLLGLPARNDLDGQSLRGLFDRAYPRPRPAELYAETLSPRLSQGWSEMRAVILGDHKYVHGARPEMFDLGADPAELRNRVSEEPERAQHLRRGLEGFLKAHASRSVSATVEVDAETRERLEALGYLGAGGAQAGTIVEALHEGGTPPQDRVEDVSAMTRAKNLLLGGLPLDALQAIRRLLQLDPDNAYYLEIQAYAQAQLGLLDDALGSLKRIGGQGKRARFPEDLQVQIGYRLHGQGRRERGLQLIRESQERKPRAETSYLLSVLLRQDGQAEAGRQALKQALELDPQHAPALVDLGIQRAEEGDLDAASDLFLHALRVRPYYARAHYNYGTFQLQASEPEPALSSFERAIELDADYLPPYYAAAVLARELGRTDRSRELVERLKARAPDSPEAKRARSLETGG